MEEVKRVGKEEWRIVIGSREVGIVSEGSRRSEGRMARG